MSNPRVYIPSRGRPGNVPKLLKAWDEELFDVKFMVEPDEYGLYQKAIPSEYKSMAEVLSLPDRNLGVGYSRTLCLFHAQADGFESIICSDDDIKPATKNANMDKLIDLCAQDDVIGATAWYSYQDLMLGIKGKDRDEVIVSPTCIVRLFGLNVERSLEIGGFDSNLKCGDDADFMIRATMEGVPWLIHLGAKAASMGARFATGGVDALEKATSESEVEGAKGDNTEHAVRVITAKFPDYAFAVNERKLRYRWKNLYADYLGDWHKYSPLHEGDITEYFGEGWTAP